MNLKPFGELLQYEIDKNEKNEKNEKKEKKENSSLNIESQKITLALSKKNIEISLLKKQINENLQYIASIQS